MSAAAAVNRGLEIALGVGYEPLDPAAGRAMLLPSDSAEKRLPVRRISANGQALAVLRWNGLGVAAIEFRNDAGIGGITLTNLFPDVESRWSEITGPDFARNAAAAFLRMSPEGLPVGKDESVIALGGPDAERDLRLAMAALAVCSVAVSEEDVIEATQTMSWPDGVPCLSSWGTTRTGESLRAVLAPRMEEVVATLRPVVTAKLRPPLEDVDHPLCPSYMIRDDLETHPSIVGAEDRIRAVRAARDGALLLGIPMAETIPRIEKLPDGQ